jgi:hypothetical protein
VPSFVGRSFFHIPRIAELPGPAEHGNRDRAVPCRFRTAGCAPCENDGDAKVDLSDPGCSGALDDDETDAPTGLVIADGFETGLGAWTVTGTGAPWRAR